MYKELQTSYEIFRVKNMRVKRKPQRRIQMVEPTSAVCLETSKCLTICIPPSTLMSLAQTFAHIFQKFLLTIIANKGRVTAHQGGLMSGLTPCIPPYPGGTSGPCHLGGGGRLQYGMPGCVGCEYENVLNLKEALGKKKYPYCRDPLQTLYSYYCVIQAKMYHSQRSFTIPHLLIICYSLCWL